MGRVAHDMDSEQRGSLSMNDFEMDREYPSPCFQNQMPLPASVSNKEHSMLLDSDAQDPV